MIQPIILAGGSGTRLWPVSRKSYPKQFVELDGDNSLFQKTVERVAEPGFSAPLIVTGEDYWFIVQQQLADVDAEKSELIVEPVGRNTAAAVLAAALRYKEEPETILLVLPSDHAIEDVSAFRRTMVRAEKTAKRGKIVTFGIKPDHAATGFGYLRVAGGYQGALLISTFAEKPDAQTAKVMLESGDWLWNAGMFMFRVDTVLKAFEAHAPEMSAPVEAAVALGQKDLGFYRLDQNAFSRCPSLSFDHAVMEHVEKGVVAFELDCGWSDLGSWKSVKDQGQLDEGANVTSGNSTAIDCRDSLLRSENPDIKLVGLGLKDIVAVATDDGILVADMSHSAEVGKVVDALRNEGSDQAEVFRRCHRPWGHYETLSLGPRFQVKRIMVLPGAKLSLQSHMHRAEHWVVVSGSAARDALQTPPQASDLVRPENTAPTSAPPPKGGPPHRC
ncbi:mannose-1-phosphate guanylyltransferase/mannose-6-phosphate isomerase [Ruegeria conchae]|uniref:mannose-1-phosphate guanylyltransferase/mannose-6-phosphate isomerase n=1 Tax=Ruegeria conchae TaxID=981384 RepID=UPI0029C804EB|nr:mannose-1-phosphate guanylyltransferase/mannose-6-phosphate isomerase [Ruegeria conchae]